MKQKPTQTSKFVNLDEIPSPYVEPTIPTPMVEEIQPTTMVGMDIDMPEMGQGQQAKEIGYPSHHEHAEETQRVKATTQNHEKVIVSGWSHIAEWEQQ
jgi:hypothetical protein